MSGDAAAFLLSAACGAALLLIWDVFHALRAVIFKGAVLNTVLDIVWWLCAAVLPLWCLWNTNSMRFRGFELLGAVLGGVLYHFTVSGMIRRLFEAVFRIFFKIFKLFLKILLTPALFLYKILISVFLRPFKNLFARARRSK